MKTKPIPGHVYRDNKGEELLFLGQGRYFREDDFGGWTTPTDDSFLYMKVKDLDAKLADGRLTPDLRTYDPLSPSKPDFWRTVFFSKKPRSLVEDLGQRYPDGYFEHLVITDLAGKYCIPQQAPYCWHIVTGGAGA